MSNFYEAYAKDKTKEQILKDYKPSTFQDYQQIAITVRAADDIVSASDKLSLTINTISESINKNTESNTNLSTRLLWLNVILAIITAIGVVFTVISVIATFNK